MNTDKNINYDLLTYVHELFCSRYNHNKDLYIVYNNPINLTRHYIFFGKYSGYLTLIDLIIVKLY